MLYQGSFDTESDMHETLAAPKKQSRARWIWLTVAVGSLGLVAVVVNATGVLSMGGDASPLDHVARVHHSLNEVITVLAEEGADKFSTKGEFLYDAHAEKGNPPNAMSVKAHMKLGEKKEQPMLDLVLAAQNGKGGDLKKRFEGILEDITSHMHESKADKIKKATKISADGDAVTLSLEVPKKAMKKEKEEMAQAFKEHKPEFHASATFGRTLKEMHEKEKLNVMVAPRGIEISVEAFFASPIFELLRNVHAPPKEISEWRKPMEALQSSSFRNEVYYKSEEAWGAAFPELPSMEQAVEGACGGLPPGIAKRLVGIDKELAGLTSMSFTGLAYSWELVVDFKDVDPSHMLAEHCALAE